MSKVKSNFSETVKEKNITNKADELIKKLIPSQTILYHNVYGEGVFDHLEGKYIYVKFEGVKEIKTFIFPDAIGKYLFTEKPTEIIRKEMMVRKIKEAISQPKKAIHSSVDERYKSNNYYGGIRAACNFVSL